MKYTPPEPVQLDKHIPTGVVIRGYKAEHLHASFIAGAASRDAEVEALKADAGRYKWLRYNQLHFSLPAVTVAMLVADVTELDAAIDAARSK